MMMVVRRKSIYTTTKLNSNKFYNVKLVYWFIFVCVCVCSLFIIMIKDIHYHTKFIWQRLLIYTQEKQQMKKGPSLIYFKSVAAFVNFTISIICSTFGCRSLKLIRGSCECIYDDGPHLSWLQIGATMLRVFAFSPLC